MGGPLEEKKSKEIFFYGTPQKALNLKMDNSDELTLHGFEGL